MRRDPTRTVLVVLAAVTVSCTTTDADLERDSTAETELAPGSADMGRDPAGGDPTAPTNSSTGGGTGVAVLRATGSSVEVPVSGGDLPGVLVTSMRSQGGELIDTADWVARYGSAGLPLLTGPGVRLVAAEFSITPTPDGFEVSDGLQWLAMSTTPATVVLDHMLTATHPDGDRAAMVAHRHDDTAASCVEWQLDNWTYSGCDYTDPALTGMIAVSVTRTLHTAVLDPDHARFDPFATVVFDTLDAQVRSATVLVDRPDPTGATWIVQITAEVPDATNALGALTDTVLAGWTPAHGTTPLFRSQTGATVSVSSPDTITYRIAGSW